MTVCPFSASSSDTVLWVPLHEAEQTQLFSLVALWICGADSDNSLSSSASRATVPVSQEKPKVPFLGLVHSDWNSSPLGRDPFHGVFWREQRSRGQILSRNIRAKLFSETPFVAVSSQSCSLHSLLPFPKIKLHDVKTFLWGWRWKN